MVKNMISGLAVALVLAGSPHIARAEVPAVSAQDRAQLEQLNTRWLKSYETRDTQTLGSILADDFIGMYGPNALSKAQMLANLTNPRRRTLSVTWKDLKINVNGDTAVVTAISTVTAEQDGKQATTRNRFADVYDRRNGEWKAIAAHVVRMEN